MLNRRYEINNKWNMYSEHGILYKRGNGKLYANIPASSNEVAKQVKWTKNILDILRTGFCILHMYTNDASNYCIIVITA